MINKERISEEIKKRIEGRMDIPDYTVDGILAKDNKLFVKIKMNDKGSQLYLTNMYNRLGEEEFNRRTKEMIRNGELIIRI